MLEELYEDNLIGDPADLEEIIREHEEQDDNPDDPESGNLEGYDDQENVGAAENENENADAAATTEIPKKKVIRRPQFTLNPQRLTGPRGVGVLENTFKDFKFLGKGHEKEDLNRVMKQLEHWAHRMFPKYQFDDCLEKIEKLGLKKEVQTYVKKIRLGMETGDQDMVLREGNEEEQQAMENDAPTDAFDELLGRQIQIETERQNNASSTRTTPAQPKAPPPPPLSSQNTIQLTEEQRERMLRNRLLAEERRLARLKAKREAELAAQQASTLGLTISNISADNSAGDNTTSDSQQPSISGVGIANTTVAADVQTSASESVTNELNSQDLLSAVSKTVEPEPTPQSQKPSTSGLDSSSRTSTNSLDPKNVHSISHLENSTTDIVNHHTDTNDISQSYNIDTPVKEGTVLNSLKEDNIASKQLNPEESDQNSLLEEESIGSKQLNPNETAQNSLLEEDIISKQLNSEEIVQNSLLEENSTVSKQLNPEESAKDSLLEEDNTGPKELNSEVLEEDNTKQLDSEECSEYSLLKENDTGSKQLNSEKADTKIDNTGSKRQNVEETVANSVPKEDTSDAKQLNLEDTDSKEYNASSKQLNSEESGQYSLSKGFRRNIVDSSKSFMLDEDKSPTVSIIDCEKEPVSLLEKEAETPPQAANEKTSSTLLNVQTKDLSLAINEEENRQVSQSVNIEDNVTLSSSADKELTILNTAIDVQNSINGSKDITEIITETMIIDTENVSSNSTTVFTESRSDTKKLDEISKLDERNNIPESTIDKMRSDFSSSDGDPKSTVDEDPNAMEIDTSFGTN